MCPDNSVRTVIVYACLPYYKMKFAKRIKRAKRLCRGPWNPTHYFNPLKNKFAGTYTGYTHGYYTEYKPIAIMFGDIISGVRVIRRRSIYK